MATSKDIVRLAREVKWRVVKAPQGEIVEPQTVRQMIEYAAGSLKRKKARKRAHAAVG